MNSEPTFPAAGRLAGIDYGTVRTGISICDPSRILVSPFDILQRDNDEKDALFFQGLAAREEIEGFVVGLPVHCDGGESQKSTEVRSFAKWLTQVTSLPVRLFDERFTTAAATQKLRAGGVKATKLKKRLDAVAAQIILEAFLEAARYSQETPGEGVLDEACGLDPIDKSHDDQDD